MIVGPRSRQPADTTPLTSASSVSAPPSFDPTWAPVAAEGYVGIVDSPSLLASDEAETICGAAPAVRIDPRLVGVAPVLDIGAHFEAGARVADAGFWSPLTAGALFLPHESPRLHTMFPVVAAFQGVERCWKDEESLRAEYMIVCRRVRQAMAT